MMETKEKSYVEIAETFEEWGYINNEDNPILL